MTHSPFDTDDIADLTPKARETMLDLVLAWGELDGAISILVAASFGLDPTRGAILLGRASAPEKLLRLKRLYQALGDATTAKAVGDLRGEYEQHSAGRNLVAHSKCLGVRASDPDRIIFASFEVTEATQLAIDDASIPAMLNAVAWAKAHVSQCLEFADRADFFTRHPISRPED
jgi:hypothetical protein